MNVIILAGMPASGKSTFSEKIQAALGLPVLHKDEIKETLFDTLGFRNYAEKRALDHAANAALLKAAESLMKSGVSVALDNNFDARSTEVLTALIEQYNCNCVTVFFGGDCDVFYQRYVDRDNARSRHPGHVVQDHYPLLEGEEPLYTMTREEFAEKFEKRGMKEFRCPGIRIDIDATYPEKMDADQLISQIRGLMK